jgi:pimeloyl-ACP methyl ester carboxylesterase
MRFKTKDLEVKIGDARLAVRKLTFDKNAPTIVFLHDSLGCIAVWRDFPEQLAACAGCNAIVYDRQGYGESSKLTEERTKGYLEKEAQVLLQLLDHFELERSVLFGHSDGGTIALIAAALQPERFLSVITEGAHVFVEDISLSGIKKAKDLYETTNLKQKLEKYHGSKTDKVFSIWADTWCSAEFRDWNMEQLLSDVKCPVLVLQGAEDEYGTEAQVHSIAKNVSGKSEVHLIEGVAHTPHKHVPDQVIDLCCDFIARSLQVSI